MAKRTDAYPLHLGSKGQRVRDAQWLMAGHNVFHLETLDAGRTMPGHHNGVNIDGDAGPATAQAFHDTKWLLGYPKAEVDRKFGQHVRAYLLGDEKLPAPYRKRRRARLATHHARSGRFYPVGIKGPLIGFPGQGTHSFVDPPDNWESDNAVDISIAVGTPVYAISAGVIGSSFGPLDSSNPRFAGIRLHLEVELPEGEWYYAHLSSTARGIGPGAHVKAGQLLGKSGSANGAAHLHLGVERGNPVTIIDGLPLAK